MDDGSQVQPVAMAAFVGEEFTSNACSKKTKCGRHPDKPDMFACTACPRRTCKFAMDDSSQVQPVAMAAFVGKEVTSNACSKKTKCGRHPDKPDMFACAACPRRRCKFAMMVLKCNQLLWQFLLERTLLATHGQPIQGQHPDKPTRFAGADCERQNHKFAMEDGSNEVQPSAMAAFVGEERRSNLCLLLQSIADAHVLALSFCPALLLIFDTLVFVVRAALYRGRIGLQNQDAQAESISKVVVFNLPPLPHGWHAFWYAMIMKASHLSGII